MWESEKLRMGNSTETRNLESAYAGEDTKGKIGRRGDIWLMGVGPSVERGDTSC